MPHQATPDWLIDEWVWKDVRWNFLAEIWTQFESVESLDFHVRESNVELAIFKIRQEEVCSTNK
jgi:hypothetical protein